MRLKLIHRVSLKAFRSERVQHDDGRVTRRSIPVEVEAELWVDPQGVVSTLIGRAINSKRKQSVLGGGLIKVRAARVTDIKPKEKQA